MNNPTIYKMTDIVTCRACGGREFYGELVWGLDHKAICRRCIYKDWQQRDLNWDPKTAPVFPAYRTALRSKTKAQQIESLQAAQSLVLAAQGEPEPQEMARMLLSAAQLLQDATEWLEADVEDIPW